MADRDNRDARKQRGICCAAFPFRRKRRQWRSLLHPAQGDTRGRGRASAACIAIIFAAAALAGCAQDDDPAFSTRPSEAAPGQTIELVLNPAAEDRILQPGLTWFQEPGPEGRWRTRYALGTAYPASDGYPGQRPVITRIRGGSAPLINEGPPVDVDTEVVRIPRVEPGRYRLVKLLEADDVDQGFGGPADRFSPKLTTELSVTG